MAQYGKLEYWEERYSRDPEPFDWYQRYSGVKDVLSQFVKATDNILHVGCGNSRLPEEMYDDGFTNSTSVDFSQVVIRAMQEKYRDKPTLKFMMMDAREMKDFQTGEFDAVVDKGTLDSILCGEGSTSNAQKMIGEIHRVLKQSGVYIVISYGQPIHRMSYLEKPEFEWEVTVHQVAKPSITTPPVYPPEEKEPPVHYMYVCKKKEVNEENSQLNIQ